MSDLISRQAAIDELERGKDKTAKGTIGSFYNTIIQNDIDKIKALPSVQPEQSSEIQDILEYLDTVLHPIVSPDHWNVYSELHDMISMLPSAQPEPSQVARDIANIIENEKDMRVIVRSEITDEQAILHLQASGWMQRHDKEMYESGLRAQLADDNDSDDALLESVQPEPCEDAVSRKAVEEMLQNGFPARGMWEIEGDVVKQTVCETLADALMDLEKLPSVTPKQQRWIPVTLETLPNPNSIVVVCGKKGTWDFGMYSGWYGDVHSWKWKKNTIKHVYWWMYKTDALPEPYREEGVTK